MLDKKIAEKLYSAYVSEMNHFPDIERMSMDEFAAASAAELAEYRMVFVGDETDPDGIMYFDMSETEDGTRVMIPLNGLYYSNPVVLHKLFSTAADMCVRSGRCHFQAYLYAHDESAIRYFRMTQFGLMYELGLHRIAECEACNIPGYTVSRLSAQDIENEWSDIWHLTQGIIAQINESPVFYPGTEFTEEVYRAFYLDASTALFAAYTESGEMVGIIDSSRGEDRLADLIMAKTKHAAVGEVYVKSEHRGTGVSNALFRAAEAHERDNGAEYLWVGHGTANFYGKSFWDRYFTTYAVETTRDIAADDRRV